MASLKNLAWQNKLLTALSILGALAFLPLIHAGFIYWDDRALLTANDAVLAFDLKTIFTDLTIGGLFPLTLTWLATLNTLFGLNPTAYHSFNVLLHFVNSFLVFKIARILFGLQNRTAWTAALLFMVHPLRVEPAAWVTGGLKDLLSAFFFMSALIVSRRSYWLTFPLIICALLSKAMAVTFPMAYLMITPIRGERISKRDVFMSLPFFGLSILAALLELKGQRTGEVLASINYTIFDGIKAASIATSLAAAKMFAPADLAIFYDPDRYRFSVTDYVGIAVGILFIGALIVKRLPLKTWLLLCMSLILVAPVIKFVPFGKTSLFNDRYLYLPSLAFMPFVVLGVKHLFRRNLIVAVIPVLTALTFNQTQTWMSQETIWLNVLKTMPGSAKAYQNLSLYYIQTAQNEKALDTLKRAIEAEPHDVSTKINYAVFLTRVNRFQEAETVFLELLKLEPQNSTILHNLGYTYHRAGVLSQAVRFYEEALKYDPNFAPSRQALEEIKHQGPGAINSGSPAKK